MKAVHTPCQLQPVRSQDIVAITLAQAMYMFIAASPYHLSWSHWGILGAVYIRLVTQRTMQLALQEAAPHSRASQNMWHAACGAHRPL